MIYHIYISLGESLPLLESRSNSLKQSGLNRLNSETEKRLIKKS